MTRVNVRDSQTIWIARKQRNNSLTINSSVTIAACSVLTYIVCSYTSFMLNTNTFYDTSILEVRSSGKRGHNVCSTLAHSLHQRLNIIEHIGSIWLLIPR